MKKHLAGIACLMFFCGCAAMIQADVESRLNTYNQTDKNIIDSFYTISQDGRQYGLQPDLGSSGWNFVSLDASQLTMSKKISSDLNLDTILASLKNYTYDGRNDIIAQKYIAAAKNRGNRIKLYKPAIAKTLAGYIKQPAAPNVENAQTWCDLDNVLIEYSSGHQIITFLMRTHLVVPSIMSEHFMYSIISMGQDISMNIENKVSNSVFKENYIRDL